MDRYICVHGHFYQPPRENPWLEAIELQDSAYPHHDWNARITSECYAPNATSRILNDRGEIVRIVNNYAKISFNFGPTLLAWMEVNAPDVYQAVLRADVESQERCGGHGSAMAQAYNHVILPLASARDRETQAARLSAQLAEARLGALRMQLQPHFLLNSLNAIAVIGKLHLAGYFAWLIWLFVHLMYIVEFANRVLVLIQWAWNYLTWNRPARLITGESPLPIKSCETGPPQDGQRVQDSGISAQQM